MIEKQYGLYHLECDACSECVDDFETYQDTLDYIKENDWKIKKEGDTYIHLCDDCAKKI